MTMRFIRFCSRALACIALVPVLTGCYAYVATGLGNVPVGTSVRALLSKPAQERLWSVVPQGRQYLDGRLLSAEGDTLFLEVTIPNTQGTGGDFLQRIPLSRGEIVLLQTRRLDRRKTTMLGGALGAVAVAMVVRILSGPAGGGAWPPVDSGINELVMWLRASGPAATVQGKHSP